MNSNTAIERLLEIMARLRDPVGGCPWDLKQDFRSIGPYTLEESFEVVDAIERGDVEDLRDELGDLLLQVVFHAQMAREEGIFGFEEVVGGMWDKMIRRHPHVFAESDADNTEAVLTQWDAIKHQEKGGQPQSLVAFVSGQVPGIEGHPQSSNIQKAQR